MSPEDHVAYLESMLKLAKEKVEQQKKNGGASPTPSKPSASTTGPTPSPPQFVPPIPGLAHGAGLGYPPVGTGQPPSFLPPFTGGKQPPFPPGGAGPSSGAPISTGFGDEDYYPPPPPPAPPQPPKRVIEKKQKEMRLKLQQQQQQGKKDNQQEKSQPQAANVASKDATTTTKPKDEL